MSASHVIDALNRTIEQLHKSITACEHSSFKPRLLTKIEEVVDEIRRVSQEVDDPPREDKEEESRKLDL